MKDRKINVDRPQLTAEEIHQGKNFDAIVRNHQLMSKPFYKQTWFYGTTGLASIGIIIGGMALQSSNSEPIVKQEVQMTDVPPNLIALHEEVNEDPVKESTITEEKESKTIEIEPKNIQPIEETTTLKLEKKNSQNTKPTQEEVEEDFEEIDESDKIEKIEQPNIEEKKKNNAMDMFPRISDKIGGAITRNELFDNKGITTEGDISIIHFELHLIDGLGGKVYAQEGNTLNSEMKSALDKVGQGETIYFENIRGKIKNGTEVRLNPLRYVLMN